MEQAEALAQKLEKPSCIQNMETAAPSPVLSAVKVSQNKSTVKAQRQEKPAQLVLTDPNNNFFAHELDDRSTIAAKVRSSVLGFLLFMQMLSNTPGIGSSQSLSQFVISHHQISQKQEIVS
jgi:hypothetical protein